MIELVEVVKPHYGLTAHVSGLPAGFYCRVYPAPVGTGVMGKATPDFAPGTYVRKTCNGAKAGIRYATYPDYPAAAKAALAWANKKAVEAAKATQDTLNDFNYVGSRHHY